MRTTILIVATTIIALAGCGNTTRTAPSGGTKSPSGAATERGAAEPDNTAVNKRDRDAEAKTPIDQKENQQDITVTADIRKQIVAHKDMSVNARNVKIITADGKVTLRGPVDSAAERDTIEKIARDVAGKDNVDNQIEVTSK
jgi:hyperosmotically inducible protein